MRVKDGTIGESDPGTAPDAGPAGPQGNFVVLKHAVTDRSVHVLFQIERRRILDRSGLVPAMKVAIAYNEFTTRAFVLYFRVDGILTRSLTGLESTEIVFKRPGPERALFNNDPAAGKTIGVKLNAVAGGMGDFAVPDRDVTPASGDAVRVLLIVKAALEEVMDAAVLNPHPCSEDPDAISAAVPDLAIPKDHIIGRDFDEIAALPVTVNDEIFVDSRFGDLKPAQDLRISGSADISLNPDRILCRAGEGKEQEEPPGFH